MKVKRCRRTADCTAPLQADRADRAARAVMGRVAPAALRRWKWTRGIPMSGCVERREVDGIL
jgi:hypothetical protein